ncbi:armadillo repeat-containing X-linked protein 1-like isoform X2 [Argopecten irradians]|uniref:armadillo repeat-containing X-linked protein 1-like isoform X2 n=1 Tax=Argopecten irradians TaxID=31199 RepID=UPI0037240E5F
MASTLATRVGAGTIIAVGIVIVSLIWWKKKKRGQVPKDPKPPTSNVIVQTSAGKDTIVSASGDASLSQKTSAVQVEGQITGSGDSSMPDNYVCENGVCRLVTEPQKTKSKQKVKFDPLAEAVTKSLTEFFEGRDDLENSTDDNKKKNSDKTESDRTETHQKDTGALDSVEPENARRTVVEQAIQPSKETKVSSSLSQQGQSSESIGQVQRSQESDEVLVEHQQTSDQGQRSPERDGGSAMTNGDTEEEDEDTWEVGRYDQDDISTAILVSQNTPGILSGGNAEILVALLSHPETKLQQAALNGIKKSSTFTRNQNLFREHGCLEKLSKLLRSKSMSLRLGVKSSQEVVSSVATAITNLSANTENHKNLESCVPTLVDLTLENETGESVCLSSLQALTNLSLTDQYHRHYTRLIQKLYDLLDTHQRSIQLQSLKVLVNLSCSTEMVPHILAAKSPSCLLELLKQGTDEALILRMTTLLANILHTVREENISVSSLPPDDKAPSPETMYSALYSVSSVGAIKSKVFLLCRHRNEDIKHQATRIYQLIAK